MDQVTVPRATVQQALEALLLCDSKDAGKAMAAITALRAALEQPQPEPARRVYLVVTGEVHEGQETYTRHEGNPPPLCDFETLYTNLPRREPLTVTDLQQALVDVDLVDPDAIDDPDGFDNGFTLQQIDALHRRLMQTTPPTTTTQREPK
jgi:hypothetical protein